MSMPYHLLNIFNINCAYTHAHKHMYIHRCTHTYVLCNFGGRGRDMERNREEIIREKITEPEPVEETITVIAHTNIQFIYTVAIYTQRNFFQPNARNNSFSFQSIHRMWLVKGRENLKKFFSPSPKNVCFPGER